MHVRTPPAIPLPHQGMAQEPSAKRPCLDTSPALTAEQQHVVEALCNGRNVFATGPAGVGKSFLIKHILRQTALHPVFVTGFRFRRGGRSPF